MSLVRTSRWTRRVLVGTHKVGSHLRGDRVFRWAALGLLSARRSDATTLAARAPIFTCHRSSNGLRPGNAVFPAVGVQGPDLFVREVDDEPVSRNSKEQEYYQSKLTDDIGQKAVSKGLQRILSPLQSPGPDIIDVTIDRNPLRNERVLANAHRSTILLLDRSIKLSACGENPLI
jgi:hypothetical protein